MSVWSFFLTPSAFRRSFALRVSDAQHEHSMKLAVLVAVAKLWARQELYSTDCLLDASRSLICCRQLSDLLYIGFLLQNTIPDIFRYPPSTSTPPQLTFMHALLCLNNNTSRNQTEIRILRRHLSGKVLVPGRRARAGHETMLRCTASVSPLVIWVMTSLHKVYIASYTEAEDRMRTWKMQAKP